MIAALQDEAAKHKGSVTQNFTVKPEWLTDISRKLDSAGVKLDDRLKSARDAVLTRELDRRIARMAFSDSGQARRDFRYDDQLLRGLELLRGNATQMAVFQAAKKG